MSGLNCLTPIAIQLHHAEQNSSETLPCWSHRFKLYIFPFYKVSERSGCPGGTGRFTTGQEFYVIQIFGSGRVSGGCRSRLRTVLSDGGKPCRAEIYPSTVQESDGKIAPRGP